jgi:hypothetical protein
MDGYIVFTVPGTSPPAAHDDIQLQAVLAGLDYNTVPKPVSGRSAFCKAVATVAKMHELTPTRDKYIKDYVSYDLKKDGYNYGVEWNQGTIAGPSALVKSVTAVYHQLMGAVDEKAWGKATSKFLDNHCFVPLRPDRRVWWCSVGKAVDAEVSAFVKVLQLAGITMVFKGVALSDKQWLVPKVKDITEKRVHEFHAAIAGAKLNGKYLAQRQAQATWLSWTVYWLEYSLEEIGYKLPMMGTILEMLGVAQ